MFREVRRNKKQVLSKDECSKILSSCSSGVLSVLGDDDYPYGVPLSYSYKDNRLYFHGMQLGHKIDSIKKHNKVSFTVIETDQVVAKEYTTYFRSVIVFGKAHIVEDLDEKRDILMKLIEKYSPDFVDGGDSYIEDSINAVGIFYIDIEHISGKEAIEFADMKE